MHMSVVCCGNAYVSASCTWMHVQRLNINSRYLHLLLSALVLRQGLHSTWDLVYHWPVSSGICLSAPMMLQCLSHRHSLPQLIYTLVLRCWTHVWMLVSQYATNFLKFIFKNVLWINIFALLHSSSSGLWTSFVPYCCNRMPETWWIIKDISSIKEEGTLKFKIRWVSLMEVL